MKKKATNLILTVIAVLMACTLTACFKDNDKPKDSDDKTAVTYHLNGGYRGESPENTDDYKVYIPDYGLHQYKTIKVQKDTWYLESWYFDEELTERYSIDELVERSDEHVEIHLYAKWIDRVTVTKDNFTDFFTVKSSWNGGLNAGGNAAINYSFEPKMAFDPSLSAEYIEIDVNPKLTSNGNTTWDGGTNTIQLISSDDYFYYGQKRIGSSAGGTQFQIGGQTLSWKLVTESFELQLLHRDPITVHLELDGSECENDSISVEGGRTLLKSSLPTPAKSGYRFMGWYADSELKTEYADKMITTEKTIYAKFTKEITVTFHANGGSEKQPLILLEGQYISIGGEPEKENCKFMGWYYDEDFKNKYSSTVAGDDDIDLYARWEAWRTITFVTNGGSEKQPLQIADTETPKLGDKPVKNGVEFIGWYTDSAFTQKYEVCPVSGDLTLYALWAQRLSISYPSYEDLQQYLDIEIVEEYTTITENRLIKNIRKFTLTATVKEQYRFPGLYINGSVELKFRSANNQDFGNLYINNFTLDTDTGKFTCQCEAYIEQNRSSAYESSVTWTPNPYISYAYVYLPENQTEDL